MGCLKCDPAQKPDTVCHHSCQCVCHYVSPFSKKPEDIERFLSCAFFKILQTDWAADIQGGVTPYARVDALISHMKADLNVVFFANYIAARNWDQMLAVMNSHLRDNVRQVFNTPAAARFYEDFRALLITKVSAVGIFQPPKEAVDHPDHYGGKDNPYETVKVCEAWGFDRDAYLFLVVKYITRADKKGAELEDLEKARWYLDRKIKQVKEDEQKAK